MTDIQKQAVKDLLHLLVDKEFQPVVAELLQKLPPPWNGLASSIFGAIAPVLVAEGDKAIDSL